MDKRPPKLEHDDESPMHIPVMDQAQTQCKKDSVHNLKKSTPLAQSFVPEMTGYINAVELYMKSNRTVTVRMCLKTSLDRMGNMQCDVAKVEQSNEFRYVRFELDKHMFYPVVARQPEHIVAFVGPVGGAKGAADFDPDAAYVHWCRGADDMYEKGDAFMAGPSRQWFRSDDHDFAFKIYISKPKLKEEL